MLRFDFLNKIERFVKPINIIQTHEICDVTACLAEIEQATRLGYYAAGYIAYEAAPAFDEQVDVRPKNAMPILWFGIYETPILDEDPKPIIAKCQTVWQANVDKKQYREAIAAIKAQIKYGNTYQTNYTIRLASSIDADPYSFYLHLLTAQQASYSAYLDIGDHVILSVSPELFFHYRNGKITTKPMKGTARRGVTLQEDRQNCQQLFNEKNLAENMMIVDLLRNDLNRIAEIGSVKVDALFSTEKYPTVWQLTSTISASLPKDTSINTIFKALFPCGSITGAPKKSTMKLITELEQEARGVYCGAIGYITPNQEMIFNVAIRTLTINKQNCNGQYGVGGGITWDSAAEDEYQEMFDKAQILNEVSMPSNLLESILLENGTYFLLSQHVDRLSESAEYFGFPCHQESIKRELYQFASTTPNGRHKIRLLLDEKGAISLQSNTLADDNNPVYASLSPTTIDSSNRFLYHKTTKRDFYPNASLEREYLLSNERGELTEFVTGNLVLFIDGNWLTPPVSSGLLPGTFRGTLIKAGKIKEKVLCVDDLDRAEKIALINSVRKWRDVIWLKANEFG